MIRHAIDAALLRRDPYLRMVVARDGVADGAIVVAVVFLLLLVPRLVGGLTVFTVLVVLRMVLRGLVIWIVVAGLVYLVGRHALEGEGSFPGTMAAVSIGFPVLLSSMLLAPFVDPFVAELIVSAWLVATLWVAARVALELDAAKGALAAVGGWVAFQIVAVLFRL